MQTVWLATCDHSLSPRHSCQFLRWAVCHRRTGQNSATLRMEYHFASIPATIFRLSSAGIRVLKDKWNDSLQIGIIRVNHKALDQVRASLALIEQIDQKPVVVRSIGVSGILKKAEKKYLAS